MCGRGLDDRGSHHRLAVHTHGLEFGFAQGSWQVIPCQLFFNGIGLGLGHAAPVVDRACGARWYTGHAQIALFSIDHVIARIVRDGANGARGLAGVATNADLGINQVLLN